MEIFSVKSAYHAISSQRYQAEDRIWNLVWHWQGPHNMIAVVWDIVMIVLRVSIRLLALHVAGIIRASVVLET